MNPSCGSAIGWYLDQSCDITHFYTYTMAHSRRDTPLGAYIVTVIFIIILTMNLSPLTSSVDALSDSNCVSFLLLQYVDISLCW